jgi:hypothetical protein
MSAMPSSILRWSGCVGCFVVARIAPSLSDSRMKLAKRLLVLFAVVAVLAIAADAASGQAISREAEFKGRIVGILSTQVTWPSNRAPSVANPLTIGIVGDNPFVDNRGVDHLEKKLAGSGAVVLSFPDETAYRDCHILVVAKSADFEKALAKVKGAPVLVVSESPGLARKGAAINIVYDQALNIIRLEINPSTAKNHDLTISQGLLRSPQVDIVNVNVN